MPNAIVFAPLETYWESRQQNGGDWRRRRGAIPVSTRPCPAVSHRRLLSSFPHRTQLTYPGLTRAYTTCSFLAKLSPANPPGEAGAWAVQRQHPRAAVCPEHFYQLLHTGASQHGRTLAKPLYGNQTCAVSPPELRLLLEACFLRLGSQTRSSKSITRG